MKTLKNIGFQGDVMLILRDALPADAVALPRTGRLVVAHSETGHHHAIEQLDVVMYGTSDPLVCYLQIADYAELMHHRPWHTHEAWRLPAGVIEVRRQREYTPDGWRQVQD